jgi:hypothetical protein
MKQKIKITRKIGFYSHPPLPDEWGLNNGKFELHSNNKSYVADTSKDKINVSPADITSVVVANYELIAAGIGVVSAAISGIFAYLSSKNGGSIKIIGKNGRSIEIPEGTKENEIEFYIQKAKELDVDEIKVSEYGTVRKGKEDGAI